MLVSQPENLMFPKIFCLRATILAGDLHFLAVQAANGWVSRLEAKVWPLFAIVWQIRVDCEIYWSRHRHLQTLVCCMQMQSISQHKDAPHRFLMPYLKLQFQANQTSPREQCAHEGIGDPEASLDWTAAVTRFWWCIEMYWNFLRQHNVFHLWFQVADSHAVIILLGR